MPITVDQVSERSRMVQTPESVVAMVETAESWVTLMKDHPGEYDIRSRSEMGGSLVLYKYDRSSPTGVYGKGSVRDLQETRKVLYDGGVLVHMGAY